MSSLQVWRLQILGLVLVVAAICSHDAVLAQPSGAEKAASEPAFLLTVFLRHDESKTLDQINQHLRDTGYYRKFPPPGIEVVSWYVVMGIGQVVTLRVPPDRLREVNRVLEETAWGGYRTEFYPTYDYKAAAEEERKRNQ
jgi:hypothetical protein